MFSVYGIPVVYPITSTASTPPPSGAIIFPLRKYPVKVYAVRIYPNRKYVVNA